MDKATVDKILNRQRGSSEVTSKKIEYSPSGQECWLWNEIKKDIKYIAIFNSKGIVEQCLLVPLTTKSFETHKKVFNLLLKSELNGKAWITPSNSNGIKCLITTIELRKDPLEYGFMIGEFKD